MKLRGCHRLQGTVLAFVLISSFAVGPSAKAQCNSRAMRISSLQRQVKADELNIQRLGFKETAKDLDEWGQLAEERKSELQKAARSALLDDLLTGVGMPMNIGGVKLKNGVASIGSVKANEIIGRLQRIGLDDPYLADLIRSYARMGKKPEKLAKLTEIYERVSSFRDVAILPNSNNDVEIAGTFVGAIAELRGIPGLDLAASNSQALVMLGYALFKEKKLFRERIDEFASLTENQLVALKSSMHALDVHVRNLRSAKQEYADCQQEARKNAVLPARKVQAPTQHDQDVALPESCSQLVGYAADVRKACMDVACLLNPCDAAQVARCQSQYSHDLDWERREAAKCAARSHDAK